MEQVRKSRIYLVRCDRVLSGARGNVLVWGTMLKSGRSRFHSR
jgi:hypothetical protein